MDDTTSFTIVLVAALIAVNVMETRRLRAEHSA